MSRNAELARFGPRGRHSLEHPRIASIDLSVLHTCPSCIAATVAWTCAARGVGNTLANLLKALTTWGSFLSARRAINRALRNSVAASSSDHPVVRSGDRVVGHAERNMTV